MKKSKEPDCVVKTWHTPLLPYIQMAIPILIFVLGVYVRQVDTNIGNVKEQVKENRLELSTELKEYDAKVFKHLTNGDIHTPKSVVISKAEFDIYRTLLQTQYEDLRHEMVDLRETIVSSNNNKKVK